MSLEYMSLVRQMDTVIRTLFDELRYLTSGTVFVQIRNDSIGKFGIKHDPIEMGQAGLPRVELQMSEEHLKAFRQMAIGSLEHKKSWTHGEIYFEFAMRRNVLCASVQFESNYNMANLFGKTHPPKG
jgi:hypothetical protein